MNKCSLKDIKIYFKILKHTLTNAGCEQTKILSELKRSIRDLPNELSNDNIS